MPEILLYGAEDVARMTSLSLRKVRELIAAGTLASVKIGRRRLVRRADIEALASGASDAQVAA